MYIVKEDIEINRFISIYQVSTYRFMDRETFSIYRSMLSDYQDENTTVVIADFLAIEDAEKSTYLNQIKNQRVRIHSNYLTIHQDIDSLINMRGGI